MNKLASYKFDILDYLMGGELEKVAETLSEVSADARKAVIPGFDELQERPNSDFALVTFHPNQGEIKKYAKYDKASTEISIAFLEKAQNELPDEILKVASTNLKKASREWGLDFPESLEPFVKEAGASFINPLVSFGSINEAAYAEKTLLNESIEKTAYALPTKEKYPIRDSAEVQKAAAYFDRYMNEMDPADAVEYAQNVKKASVNFDMPVNRNLDKFAELDVNTLNKDFSFLMDARVDYLSDNKELAESYLSLKKEASEKPIKDVFNELLELDKSAELYHYWGAGLAHPAIATFAEKVASSGITLEDLRSIDNAELTGIVGTSAVSDLKGEEGLAVYHSLPTPIKKEIEALLGR